MILRGSHALAGPVLLGPRSPYLSIASQGGSHTVVVVHADADFLLERELLAEFGSLVAFDEVGRGAAAGPVCVGAVFLDAAFSPPPAGLRDSKVLSASRRTELFEPIRTWAPHAVGHASPSEIDEFGIMLALTLAARRALRAIGRDPGVVLIDGDRDWVNPPNTLFLPSELCGLALVPSRTVVRGDASCAALAAASILAKVVRDELMVSLAEHHRAYGFDSNKGYLTSAHLDAVERLGLTDVHRASWTYAADPA